MALLRALAVVFAIAFARANGLLVSKYSGVGEIDVNSQDLPLAWFHVPKTGSSFVNALLHTPKMCPGVAKDFAVDGDHCPPNNVMGCPAHNHINISQTCPGAFSKWAEHVGVGADFDFQYRGHGIALMRQPEQRMLSHFVYGGGGTGDELEQFRQKFEGCSVKMLTRSGSMMQTCGTAPPPSQNETKEAVNRIKQFAFVGLTERWELSICLFRKMFGGKCVGADFLNTRPTENQEIIQEAFKQVENDLDRRLVFYPPEALKGFVDKADGELYNASIQKFEELAKKYNVTEESCKPCLDQKDSAYVPAEL